jgi:hypothetical protein
MATSFQQGDVAVLRTTIRENLAISTLLLGWRIAIAKIVHD